MTSDATRGLVTEHLFQYRNWPSIRSHIALRINRRRRARTPLRCEPAACRRVRVVAIHEPCGIMTSDRVAVRRLYGQGSDAAPLARLAELRPLHPDTSEFAPGGGAI